MKIKSIQFYDYRVFYTEREENSNEYFFEVDSNNLLIYGENGSGKTSFYRGLKDIINQNDFTPHFKTPLLNAGYIKIKFDDDTVDRFDATGQMVTTTKLLNVSKLNSFLSYKDILKTHLREDSEINFFEMIVKDILKEHQLQTLGPLYEAWHSLEIRDILQESVLINASVPLELTVDEAGEQIEILRSEYERQISKFNDELIGLLGLINPDVNEFLNYFNQGITIHFELDELTSSNLSEPVIRAKVTYANSLIEGHHNFLNEARLSAVAISLYLAALRTNPTVGVMKFIFFDDIFLGLDLSNRLPLLDVLKNNFADWQIFITTYDRHWFEVAKQHLDSSKWNSLEMYAGRVKDQHFEKPIVIQSLNYFSKADKYFNSGDYPAALNYLRKELESLIKDRLPEESTRHYEGKPHQLGHLWELLIERYDRNNNGNLISPKLRDDLKTLKFSLLNPQSHDNLSAPVYKHELQRGFDLIKELQEVPLIKSITLLVTGMELVFKHPALNYSLTMLLLKDWKVDIIGNVKTHTYPYCRLTYWQYNGNDYFDTRLNVVARIPIRLPEENLDKIRNNILGQTLLQPITVDMFNANTKFEDIWTIKELIDKCDDKRDCWFNRIFRK